MDTRKIGGFLRMLRKEKGLTQEQLAEQLFVSGRTVSRWETGTNLPDLSILIRIAEFYGVEVKELLNGERERKSGMMDREWKETLTKVADYSRLEREQAAKAGNTAFILTFGVCAAMIAAQLILGENLRAVMGETAAFLAGGISYLGILLYHGMEGTDPERRRTGTRDAGLSAVCAAAFAIILAVCYLRRGAGMQQSLLAAALFFAGTFLCGFGLLRLMAWIGHRRKQRMERAEDVDKKGAVSADPVRLAAVFIADGNMQADMVAETLAGKGIPSCRQELGDAGFAAARYGMGRGVDGRIVLLVPEERAQEAAGIVEGMGLVCSK